MRRPYLIRIGDWLSAGINTLLLDGTPDESTSGRSYRQGDLGGDPVWQQRRRRIDWVFSRLGIEDDHCRKAYEADLTRCRARVAAAAAEAAD
jgi:hypothetical protein